MKINSKDLFKYINELEYLETKKFKVYCSDVYLTDVFWDGEIFKWEPGKFTSGAFFDDMFFFEPIEEDNKIKHISKDNWWPDRADGNVSSLKEKLEEVIDEVNKLKEK